MAEIIGLVGLRPKNEYIKEVTCPPYDVIKPGTELENLLEKNPKSLFHITLGENPKESLENLISQEILLEDNNPCFYVYEQNFKGKTRTGVFAAPKVSDYSEKQIIRHEKTFDEKVKGRIALRNTTDFTFGPVFLLTKSPITSLLEEIKTTYQPEYDFTSDFAGMSELHAIQNRIFRVKESSNEGKRLQELIKDNPLYIADGHHRYHASLLNNQTHFLAYICEEAEIQAYNRVINGVVPFAEVKNNLNLAKTDKFTTPVKHSFCIYSQEGVYTLKAQDIPQDVVGRLDCSILEKELYPHLGLNHDMITDSKHFDYYAESELDKMQACVDSEKYDIAVALHPVSIDELMSVADAGLINPEIVMPEKSTFFAPKILSGIFIYKHKKNTETVKK